MIARHVNMQDMYYFQNVLMLYMDNNKYIYENKVQIQ